MPANEHPTPESASPEGPASHMSSGARPEAIPGSEATPTRPEQPLTGQSMAAARTGMPTGGPVPQRSARPPVAPAGADRGFSRGFGTGLGFMLGAGAVLVALSLVAILGGVLMGLFTRQSARPAAVPTSHLWGPTSASNTLLAISIKGVIQGSSDSGGLFSSATYGREIADQLDALRADDYAGVILLMDTPGGSIYGARAIADAVIRYQERTGHSVVAYVQSMSASGGMYAMAPAARIISDHGTMVGSIGVIFGPFQRYREVTGLTGNLLQSGVQTSGGITSEYLAQGTGKDFGNPYRDMTEEEREVYTNGLAAEYRQFVDFVAEHRGIEAQRIKDELGAYMFDPATAMDKGLVDEVMGRADGFRAAARLNNIDPEDTEVVAPAAPGGLAALLGAEQRVWGHNIPLDPASGLAATSQLCVGVPVVLAYAGDFQAACGG